MKKLLLMAGTIITAAAFSFAGCGSDTDSGALTQVDDVYGLGAVTTVKLLGSELSGSAVKSLSSVQLLKSTTNEEIGGEQTGNEEVGGEQTGGEEAVKEQVEEFDKYFAMLDSFLGEDVITTTAVANTDEAYAGYEIKLTITGKNFNGEDETYLMYYTETLLKEKDKNGETKQEYTLEGVMVLDGADYVLEGERTYEEERDEAENELKIRAYPDVNDRNTYVQMKQEDSADEKETEKEYVYGVYENGRLVEETAVKFETERKGEKEETEFELEFRQGESRGKYKIERLIENGVTVMEVKYEIDGENGAFRIRSTEEGYEYTFSDHSTKTFRH